MNQLAPIYVAKMVSDHGLSRVWHWFRVTVDQGRAHPRYRLCGTSGGFHIRLVDAGDTDKRECPRCAALFARDGSRYTVHS